MTDQDQQFRPLPAPPQPVSQGATSTAPQPTQGGPAGSAGSAVPVGPPESPLAGQLPGWDLQPPASLLLRRRPAR
jgi:hypothetical protein